MPTADLHTDARAALVAAMRPRRATMTVNLGDERRRTWADDDALIDELLPALVSRAEAEKLDLATLRSEPQSRSKLTRLAKRLYSARLYEGVRRGDHDAELELATLCEDEIRSSSTFGALEDVVVRRFNDSALVEDDVLDLLTSTLDQWTAQIRGVEGAAIEQPEALTLLVRTTASRRILDRIREHRRVDVVPLSKLERQADGEAAEAPLLERIDDADALFPGRHMETEVLDRIVMRDILVRLLGLVRTGVLTLLELVILLFTAYGAPLEAPAGRRTSVGRDIALTLQTWRSTAGGLSAYLMSQFRLDPTTAEPLLAQLEPQLAAAPDPITDGWVRQRLLVIRRKVLSSTDLDTWLERHMNDDLVTDAPSTGAAPAS